MNEYTLAATLDDEIQAELLEAILLERNIPALVINYHDSAFDGLFSAYQGWGCVKAPKEYHEEIRQLIESLKSEKEPQIQQNTEYEPPKSTSAE